MKILILGDVYGHSGRRIVKTRLANMIAMTKASFVVANGENLAGGFGITKESLDEMFAAGVDVVTAGNHTWDKKDALKLVESEPRLLRPANIPALAPGRGAGVFEKEGVKFGVLNLMGRVFMDAIDCPFQRAEAELVKLREETNIILVDMHAEASSEKKAMGYFLDGRVSVVYGTHTHVPTADERILPRGTGFQSDVGMTGPIHSVIGVKTEIILKRFTQKLPERFEEAHGPAELNALLVELNPVTGFVKTINRLHLEEETKA
ncbi:MAG: TIGR00282 family metallophosphoesterase [Nitrospinae bacterium]|nr:TIGR00282 family metallophosphoesterase [Nitrospinota bacterium]